MKRFFRHLIAGRWTVRRRFPKPSLQAIEGAIRNSEGAHHGEIRVCIESSLDPADILRGVTAHDRAVELFSRLRVWDTERNNGVLLYILMADHSIEILGDRDINRRAGTAFWEKICSQTGDDFRNGEFESGVLKAIQAIDAFLSSSYPRQEGAHDTNELPDAPVIL